MKGSDDIKGGQYRKKKAKKDEQEGKYFHLGKQAAKVETQRKENEQTAQMNMIQSILLNEKTNQLKDILAEVRRQQQTLEMQMMQAMAPPPLPGGGLPPFPGDMPPAGMPMEGPPMGQEGMPMDGPPMGQEGMPPQMGPGGPTPGIDMGQIPPMG